MVKGLQHPTDFLQQLKLGLPKFHTSLKYHKWTISNNLNISPTKLFMVLNSSEARTARRAPSDFRQLWRQKSWLFQRVLTSCKIDQGLSSSGRDCTWLSFPISRQNCTSYLALGLMESPGKVHTTVIRLSHRPAGGKQAGNLLIGQDVILKIMISNGSIISLTLTTSWIIWFRHPFQTRSFR